MMSLGPYINKHCAYEMFYLKFTQNIIKNLVKVAHCKKSLISYVIY